ncbi:hypothetical protein ACQW02_04160 [Humitalea sp. 24SJ18S-53]|uniref:hypothetical protein n=1 Tax=Humitalea sp. 24SJ18S-53 TaxID=3422307 RepID=UPI003D6750CC
MPLTLTTLPDTVESALYNPRAVGELKRRLDAFVNARQLPRYAGGPTLERVAFTAFQAYCRYIDASHFVYSFTQVGVPWDSGAWVTGVLRGNCMNLALGFNYLLQHLGFPVALLGLQQSHPLTPQFGKIAQKPSARLHPANVRGTTTFGGPWEYIATAYPQARITATNAVHVRRGAWFPGRHYENQNITKSHRDVFDNHWCAVLKLRGIEFPFFDPLVAARYRNGQEDMFESFVRIGNFAYKTFPTNPVFRSLEDPRTLVYAIPERFHDITDDSTFRAMKTATNTAANDDPDCRMFWQVDSGTDWFERNTGARVMPEDARPHPLFVQQLFHMCSVSRWTGSLSYAADRVRLVPG